ncbi:hypothetical protein WICPIJ_003291 [Wickerhamomyces pijperi]|uniref:IPT/TIG domain-containing protein n=1 Tax=Wickerhamomyces pijperi TaxID=599730 RepID=A0A9P8Q7D8_WICPI|nr:hypothetical protein WICPIJ_003291 [Wickerhamomyces pijperi]
MISQNQPLQFHNTPGQYIQQQQQQQQQQQHQTSFIPQVQMPLMPQQQQQQQLSVQESHPIIPFDSSYEKARDILSHLKFGTEAAIQFDNEFPKSYLEADIASLPYSLKVSNLPSSSRVETQIKLNLSISPAPEQGLVHLPADTIAKQKLCLSSPLPEEIKKDVLFLETFVLTSTTERPCNICTRCIRREQKRASRRKSGVSDNLNWSTNTTKRAIIFNSKELVSFPPNLSQVAQSKNLELSARIICYCRHHQESKGFKLLFILKNSQGEIIGKDVTSNIMIMDRKKTSEADKQANSGANGSDSNINSVSLPLHQHPLSPTSIEDDSSEPHTGDSRVFKKKRAWSPELSDGLSIAPSRSVVPGDSTSTTSMAKREPISPSSSAVSQFEQSPIHPILQQNLLPTQSQQQNNSNIPIIQRVIPSQGPLRGGIEVTLLGCNFKQGLQVSFGMNKALSTNCWSDSTMVTYLPPATQPGQVLVTVEDPENPVNDVNAKGNAIFTYLDDTDRQMIELALQIVGLKMNGKLEDARNIARKIIDGSSDQSNGSQSQTQSQSQSQTQTQTQSQTQLQHMNRPANTLDLTDESLIIKLLTLLPATTNLNWGVRNSEGQTLLHLSNLKSYHKLTLFQLQRGARVDYQDINGFTALHYAGMTGDRYLIELLLNYKANLNMKNNNGDTVRDICDANVLDVFDKDQEELFGMSRKFSSSSISSSLLDEEDVAVFSTGLHVSRMTNDRLADDSDSDDDNDDDENDEYDFDTEDYEALEDEAETDTPTTPATVTTPPTTTSPSLWNKVRTAFQDGITDDLPRYDDLFPATGFNLPKLGFGLTMGSSTESNDTTSSSVELTATTTTTEESEQQQQQQQPTEDIFLKFFNQRKNYENDKMLMYFWLPLLFVIISLLISINLMGYNYNSTDKLQDVLRRVFGRVVLGSERVKVMLNGGGELIQTAINKASVTASG